MITILRDKHPPYLALEVATNANSTRPIQVMASVAEEAELAQLARALQTAGYADFVQPPEPMELHIPSADIDALKTICELAARFVHERQMGLGERRIDENTAKACDLTVQQLRSAERVSRAIRFGTVEP